MMRIILVLGAFCWARLPDSIEFQKLNPETVLSIRPSGEGLTSRSTNAIVIEMKAGDTVSVLYDKDGKISPLTLEVSDQKSWFSVANPKWAYKKGNCSTLLCSLPLGACKCSDVVADSGYFFEAFADSAQGVGGCVLAEAKKPNSGSTRRTRAKRTRIVLTDKEMTERFLGNFNSGPRID
jgi:hypothetical protein